MRFFGWAHGFKSDPATQAATFMDAWFHCLNLRCLKDSSWFKGFQVLSTHSLPFVITGLVPVMTNIEESGDG